MTHIVHTSIRVMGTTHWNITLHTDLGALVSLGYILYFLLKTELILDEVLVLHYDIRSILALLH